MQNRKGGIKKQSVIGKREVSIYLFKYLALVKLASGLILARPREVLLHELLGLIGCGVELLPVIRLVIHLPVGAQLKPSETRVRAAGREQNESW
jgi:hypothetical protein